jgi:hypothetical protein
MNYRAEHPASARGRAASSEAPEGIDTWCKSIPAESATSIRSIRATAAATPRTRQRAKTFEAADRRDRDRRQRDYVSPAAAVWGICDLHGIKNVILLGVIPTCACWDGRSDCGRWPRTARTSC